MKAPAAAWALAAIACAWLPGAAQAQAVAQAGTGLADLSLQQLREVRVTTVSRTLESLDLAAASVYVISADDIRRSGAATIPEALRLAPALSVARADANQYAISARGFNQVLANKMLVLIDGRPVYTPLFSGVFWEAQDVSLESVDRIEVITGPSTALWGSNAVNGLIHIITHTAGATPGAAGVLRAGPRQRTGSFRAGTALGDNGHVRVHGKAYNRDGVRRADGTPVGDQADGAQIGFRADWMHGGDHATLQGDTHKGSIDQANGARRFSGAQLLANWRRTLADGAAVEMQAYIERTEREHPQIFAETLTTGDVVAQYRVRPLGGHRVLLGAGYRRSHDRLGDFAALAFKPSTRDLAWSRLFVQDQVALREDVALTLAASVERNPFTGSEVLPSMRLAWEVDAAHVVWGSLARAVRAPSRIDREYFQPAQPPYLVAGGPDFRSERADVVELGVRAQASADLSYALTAHYQRWRDLRSLAPTAAGLQFENGNQGWTSGLEAWARWRVADTWRLDAGAQALRKRLQARAGAADASGVQALGNDARYAALLRSSVDLPGRVAWDLSVRHVAALPSPQVPAYTAADTRLAWSPRDEVELSLVVMNLFDPRHPEWGAATNRAEIERQWWLQMRWRL